MAWQNFFRIKSTEEKQAEKALSKIYQEKGCYCDEYLDAFLKAHPVPSSDDHFTLCEIYTEMGKTDEAKNHLLAVRPGPIFDDISAGQSSFCKLLLLIREGKITDACALLSQEAPFLDTFMKQPVRAKIAGEYYSCAAVLSFVSGHDQDTEKYLARLREWCDLYPRHRILCEITECTVTSLKNKEEAEAAAAKCRQAILGFRGFKFDWEREYFLGKLDRCLAITHEA